MTSNPRRRPIGLLLVAAAVLSASACAQNNDVTPEEQSFDLAGNSLSISKDSGDLELVAADVPEVEVTRWFTGAEGQADWVMDDDRLQLSTDCGPLSQCEVRYRVSVPGDVTVTLTGENGDVTAAGFAEALSITTENGAIDVTDVSGDLTLHSSSGAQRASGLESARVETMSENGEITLSFADAPDSLSITTDNGAVHATVPDVPYAVTTTSESGEISDTLTHASNSPSAIRVQTSNGAVDLVTAD